MDNFGILEGLNNSVEFINIYTDENPILNKKDICYFLFSNNVDYHRPLIAKGIIIDDVFIDGMNKLYSIKVLEILETPNAIKEFILNKPFIGFPYYEKTGYIGITKKLVKIKEDFSFHETLFKIPAFFVRKSENEISQLRIDYLKIIKKDIIRQLKDIENLGI